MKWQTGISILNFSLASLALVFAGFNYSAANSSQSSSPVAIDGDGRQAPLDSLLPPKLIGLIDPSTEPSAEAPAAACVNINTADQSQLVKLKGIGPAMSNNIIEYRAKFGPFRKKEDLLKVKGIGPSKFAAIAGEICL